MEALVKPNVSNPLRLANTPGAELVFIFENHDINNPGELIGVENLNAKEHLSKELLKKSEKILGLDGVLVDFFGRFEQDYKGFKAQCKVAYAETKKQFTKLKPVIPLLRDEYNSADDRFNDILDYFDADCAEDVFAQSDKQAALYRKQNNHEPNPINLYGWLRRGELDFQNMVLPDYDESGLREWIDAREWIHHLTDADYFKRLSEILSRFGVGLSLVPHLKKTVYGAIRWYDGKPLIQISDREHNLATCWFTLFHGFGHAILHKDVEIMEGNINEVSANYSKQERDANSFANTYLYNGDNLRKAVFERMRSGAILTANSLAEEFDVNPMFASYWLLKAQYRPEFQKRYAVDFADKFQ